ncbi:hypothetical protein D3C80_2222020 [compost metagenome]
MVTPFADGEAHQGIFDFFQLRRLGQIFFVMQLHALLELLSGISGQRMFQRHQIGFLTLVAR